MRNGYAEDFQEIALALKTNEALRERMLNFIDEKNVVGKSLEGGERKQKFKEIIRKLTKGEINLNESYLMVEREISRFESIHANDNRVFPSNWGQRLVRTYFSKYYNQAVLHETLEKGEEMVFIPHSRTEKEDSKCTRIAGQSHNASSLLKSLVSSYEDGIYSHEIKIPHHPHCTHVVRPVE